SGAARRSSGTRPTRSWSSGCTGRCRSGVDASAPRAAPGVTVVLGLGLGPLRLRAPCRIVWTREEDRCAGWAYGTLPGHPESGEESFVVHRDEEDDVWL